MCVLSLAARAAVSPDTLEPPALARLARLDDVRDPARLASAWAPVILIITFVLTIHIRKPSTTRK